MFSFLKNCKHNTLFSPTPMILPLVCSFYLHRNVRPMHIPRVVVSLNRRLLMLACYSSSGAIHPLTIPFWDLMPGKLHQILLKYYSHGPLILHAISMSEACIMHGG